MAKMFILLLKHLRLSKLQKKYLYGNYIFWFVKQIKTSAHLAEYYFFPEVNKLCFKVGKITL